MKKDSQNIEAIKFLIYCLADDDLIIGHRNSEWIGLGPVLEEDIAFGSMAQDCLGHSLSYYTLLNELGEPNPDIMAFNRPLNEFKSCHLVELPIGDYAFSLVRHFLYDTAKSIKLKSLTSSSFEPLRLLAQRISREHKYHSMHGITWVQQLGNGNEDSRNRMQNALNELFPAAFGLFENHPFSQILQDEKVISHEDVLFNEWLEYISPLIQQSNLKLIENAEEDKIKYLGGRKGLHSEHLKNLLDEMTIVYKTDPVAVW